MIGWTLFRYFALRFLGQIVIVFLAISALTFLIDFVEALRRASDSPQAGAATVALMAALRMPVAAEQALPFAVLFGSMSAFIGLSRKLELVIARAAGVSVWGFLTPPMAVALTIGVLSTVAFNPAAAAMKRKADAIEVELFGRAGGAKKDSLVWLRQKSVDGRATISAEKIRDGGRLLEGVTVLLDDPNGRFVERVEAARARLSAGAWMLENARIIRPGEELETSSQYALATDMTAGDVLRDLSTVESIGFWELPEFRARAAENGLETIPFDLLRQQLLARPLMAAAMVLIAAAFSLRFFRFGGVGKMIAGGVVAGFVLYVSTKFIGDMGGSGLLSPAVAAWSPALVGSLLGALALLHQEDG